jgi:histidine ammonia-lyase
VQRARQAVDVTFDLLGFDLLEGSLWMDVRKTQDPKRSFGAAPTAVWGAFRQHVPLRQNSVEPGSQPTALVAAGFLKTTVASTFYRGEAPPGGDGPESSINSGW